MWAAFLGAMGGTARPANELDPLSPLTDPRRCRGQHDSAGKSARAQRLMLPVQLPPSPPHTPFPLARGPLLPPATLLLPPVPLLLPLACPPLHPPVLLDPTTAAPSAALSLALLCRRSRHHRCRRRAGGWHPGGGGAAAGKRRLLRAAALKHVLFAGLAVNAGGVTCQLRLWGRGRGGTGREAGDGGLPSRARAQGQRAGKSRTRAKEKGGEE